MSEIVVGDVLAWEPQLEWRGDAAELLRPLSWAVTIHPRTPALPPLRGNELIVVTQRTLDHLKQVEMVGWAEVARQLSAQPVAGLVVDHDFDNTPIPGVPIFRADTGFLAEAETHLNRTITERRGELYRLGSDLSRALSTASIAGADLDALFSVAGDVGHSQLMLFDRSGTVLGRSRTGPTELPFALAQVDAGGELPIYVENGSGRWLVDRLQASGGRRPLYLATTTGASGSPETARLVLSHTTRAIETFLHPLGDQRLPAHAPSRDALLAELLLGQVPGSRVESQSRILGIDPAAPLRVALCVSNQTGVLARMSRRLSYGIRRFVTTLSSGELAILMLDDTCWDELRAVASIESGIGLVRSERQPDLSGMTRAVRQAQTLGRLWLAGILTAPVVDAGSLGTSGLYGVLLSSLDPATFEPGRGRMAALVAGLLGALDEHDRERGSDLIRTLEGYLAAGGSTTGAAELLGVHRNTLGYRLNRISELTGSDLGDADTRLAFGLALKLRQIERALS